MRRALVLLLAGLFACQDYRFNPVGKCLLQPGQARVSVDDISTADILFVIDDSGSMDPIQAALASNFGSFITQLVATQADRVAVDKEPIDFHIAVTTSSVFIAYGGRCTAGLVCEHSIPTVPAASLSTCAASNTSCVGVVDKYELYDPQAPVCVPGVASGPGTAYPSGDFVAAPGNPKVLHFTKNPCVTGTAAQCWSGWTPSDTQHPISRLIAQFAQNVKVGSCGSGEEQHLEAARLALKKALRLEGLAQPDVQPAEWPHEKSKMVVVFVGNEDDCSNPKDPARALAYSGVLGGDMCTADQALPADQQRLYPVAEYAAFLSGLGRPFGAAFIRPGNSGCDCVAPSQCTGYSAGNRFKGLRDAIVAQGNSVVDASVCGSFAGPLQQIADLVKPPDRLNLPSAPASDVVTQLRVVGAEGKTVHVCAGPDPAREWWFVDCPPAAPLPVAAGTSACILLRPGSACEPGAGQTLQAEYLGRVPAAGCIAASDCVAALRGSEQNWVCDGATATTRGTCLCAQP